MSQKKIVMEYRNRTNTQLYKELETINLQKQLSKSLAPRERFKSSPPYLVKHYLKKIFRGKGSSAPTPSTQFELFQNSMKFLLICGQIIGLNPVIGYLEKNPVKIRFKYLSFSFIYALLVFVGQAIVTILCVLRLFRNTITITLLSFVSFYMSTATTTLLFLRVASKWPALMRDVVNSDLDKYVDIKVQPFLVFKSILLLTLALVEHLLSFNTKMMQSVACPSGNGTLYEDYIKLSFPWYAELNLPFYISTGFFLQFINVISTINWSYSDVFIVCMSIYLASILKQINRTIIAAEHKYHQPPYWSALREDYTRAARLVASFDDAISGIMLCSYATNLFFICLQLFYVFSPFGGYEYFVYFVFSFAFVFGRFMEVSLRASCVHSAAIETAPALYNLPSTVYCNEIQRFLEQVHGSTVALTGLQFFYVTRGLILSVAGTIVTYELVLLQFNGEDNKSSPN